MTSATRVLLFLFCLLGELFAQQQTIIQGEVLDPSGAAIPGAVLKLSGSRNSLREAQADENGKFSFPNVLPGEYVLQVTSPGFAPFQVRKIQATAGTPYSLRIQLNIATAEQSVEVSESVGVSTDPTSNVGAIVLKGEDLNVLSDNPDDLSSDLQALAGPSAGPNGGEIFVDGFSGGKLPPKSSIREVRVNSNPFSAEFDRLGFGRIEILTKPGTDRFRGMLRFGFGDESLNSRNPFAVNRAPYQTRQYGANLGGPINKKSSFFVDFERRGIDENAVINATILDPSLNRQSYQQAVVTPTVRTSISPRIDYQLNANNTLVGRYEYETGNNQNQGIGTFDLPQRAYDTTSKEHSLQLTETAILNAKTINETRFQYRRSDTGQLGDNSIPTLMVQQAFTSGGSQVGNARTLTNSGEWTNITSRTQGKHFIKFGGRVRLSTLSDQSPNNFGGSYTFSGALGPVLDANNQPTGQIDQIDSLERYRRTVYFQQLGYGTADIRTLGGGASQFTIAGGNPLADVTQTDVGLFFDDAFRWKSNVTLNFGLRYENQTNISSNANFAPRFSLAWGLDGAGNKPAKTVLRIGSGMFYDRFQNTYTLQALRYNGSNQVQYTVINPDFYPNVPSIESLAGNESALVRRVVSDELQSPYMLQSVIGIDRQLPFSSTVSVSYVNTRGVHTLRTRNINAPLNGIKPYDDAGNIYLYESSGGFKQNQLMVNFNTRFRRNVMLFGFYSYGHANGNTDGVGTFPAYTYDLSTEWGRSSFDIRHRFLIGGNVQTKFGITLNPMINFSTGMPFNITTGQDTNLDNQFTERPSLAAPGATGDNIKITRFGTFNLTPGPGDAMIPRNYGQGPNQFSVNMRVSKTWGFGESNTSAAGGGGSVSGGPGGMPMGGPGMGGGPRGGGPRGGGMRGGGGFGGSSGQKYSLTLSANARNLLNNVNLGSPIGNLLSGLFGQSNQLGGGFGPGGAGGRGGGAGGGGSAGNRRIELQLVFNF